MKKKAKILSPSVVSSIDVTEKLNSEFYPHNGKANGKANSKAKEKRTQSPEFYDELDMRELLRVLSEMRHGNFSVRMPIDRLGLGGKICDTLNEIILLNEALVDELTQASNTIGKQGHLNHRVSLPKYAKGSWLI